MAVSRVYAITDSGLLPGERLFTGVEQALNAGVKTVQLRDKAATGKALTAIAEGLLQLCNRYQAQLIINDQVELAAEIGAHGVHLGRSDGSLKQARKRLGPGFIIGATCHNSLAWAKAAALEGADYVAFGRFFTSTTKPNAGEADMALLHQAQREIYLPVVAIGGVTADNAAQLLRAGADSVAVCAGIFATDNITAAAERLLKAVQDNPPIHTI